MFGSLLIANRGEIACRIIGTARRLGVRAVVVYSDADAGARHVRLADDAVRIGPAPARESYLVVDKIVEAAKRAGAEAIHPGYGFLSENPALADACEAAGVVFVGPSAAAIRAMGSKSSAKAIMAQAGVPITPGYHGADQTPSHLAAAAEEIGYPVLIKATAGGGGKGMRRVDRARTSRPRSPRAGARRARPSTPTSCSSRSTWSGRATSRCRSSAISMATTCTCSSATAPVQRRHQKVLEEAPAPGLSEEQRARMGATAVLAAKAVSYVGAGTVELIVDRAGSFYFMEMNTRLQVEHPSPRRSPASIWWSGSCAWRRESGCPARRASSRCAAMRSRRASTPRTRTRASRRRSGASCTSRRRRSPSACASTRASSRATRSRRTTIR